MPISYDKAFGGVDRSQEDPRPSTAGTRRITPGVGYHEYLDKAYHRRQAAAEHRGNREARHGSDGQVPPMAFGPIGRAWQPRPNYAGTYDQKWLDERFPFLPDDFDERYYQRRPPTSRSTISGAARSLSCRT